MLQSGTFTDDPWLIVFLLFWGLAGAIGLLFVTNFVNSIYDQVDTVPVYQSVSMIFEVIAGLTVLGESDRYSTSHLVGIFIGMVVATCGILVLGCKKT